MTSWSLKVFYISHADATELSQMVNSVMRIPQMASSRW